MKAEYCVDYLSHQWNTEDLITTYQETRKQSQKYIVNNITSTTSLLTKNEKKLKKSEEYKSKRFQNALWRNMSKNCTSHLGRSNELINPSTVSWQKESDITWLYGPMYTNSNKSSMEKSKSIKVDGTQPSLQGLKPVLKKQSNVTQLLPSCSDSTLLLFYSVNTSLLETNTTTSVAWSDCGDSSVTTSGICSSRSSFSSVSSSKSTSSIGVHFNPEIIEIEYQPEYPVSLESSSHSYPSLNHSSDPYTRYGNGNYYDEDDEEEDAIWSLLVQASSALTSSTYTRIFSLISDCLQFYNTHQKHKKHTSSKSKKSQHTSKSSSHIECDTNPDNNSIGNSIQLVLLLMSMMKSFISLTTAWLLYQSLSPLSLWLSVSSKSVQSTAGQSSKQSRKAPFITL